jgi:hypothetical protein
MAEQVEKKVAKKRKPRPRPINALQFSVWSDNGSPLPESAQAQFEAAIQAVQVALFNEGIRTLTQTSRA